MKERQFLLKALYWESAEGPPAQHFVISFFSHPFFENILIFSLVCRMFNKNDWGKRIKTLTFPAFEVFKNFLKYFIFFSLMFGMFKYDWGKKNFDLSFLEVLKTF